MRGLAATAVSMAAAAMILAAPASAGTPGPTVSLGSAGGFEYLKAPFENVVSQTGAPVVCDDGDSATGGGGTISGSGATAALNASYPITSPGAGWQAEGSTSGSPRTVATYAICDEGKFGFSFGTTPMGASGQAGDVLSLFDPCAPQNTLAGFQGSGGDVRFPASFPSDGFDSWELLARNYANAPASGTQHYACFNDEVYKPKRRAESVKVDSGKAGKVTARCKGSEAVIAGGFLAANNAEAIEHDAWVTSTRPFDSKDKKKTPDDGWSVKVQNASDGKVKLTAYAACQEK